MMKQPEQQTMVNPISNAIEFIVLLFSQGALPPDLSMIVNAREGGEVRIVTA